MVLLLEERTWIQSLIAEGEWFLENGSIEDATKFFEKALELDPGNEQVLELLSLF
jgi:Tfp pilus assembly protein PilF